VGGLVVALGEGVLLSAEALHPDMVLFSKRSSVLSACVVVCVGGWVGGWGVPAVFSLPIELWLQEGN